MILAGEGHRLEVGAESDGEVWLRRGPTQGQLFSDAGGHHRPAADMQDGRRRPGEVDLDPPGLCGSSPWAGRAFRPACAGGVAAAPFGGDSRSGLRAAGGKAFARPRGRYRFVDREGRDFGCVERANRSVEDLSASYGDCTRGHHSCTDGCNDPAGDQEESLPHQGHLRSPSLSSALMYC